MLPVVGDTRAGLGAPWHPVGPGWAGVGEEPAGPSAG